MSSASAALALVARLSRLPGVAYVLSLSRLGWAGLVIGSTVLYAYANSTLASQGTIRRLHLEWCFGSCMVSLECVWGKSFSLTPIKPKRAKSRPSRWVARSQRRLVSRRLRAKMLPILGTLFGGNYAFMIWDEADPERRAICVDPADPEIPLRAAKQEGLKIHMVLTTHWHWDHSGGNRTSRRPCQACRCSPERASAVAHHA